MSQQEYDHEFAFLGGMTLLIAFSLMASTANAQWMYPMGYGGYGMSKWGADPGAGYMAGLGSFARSQGVYQLEKAKADAINADTMIKWNKALRARQQVLRAEKQKEAAREEAAARSQAGARTLLIDGTTLNQRALSRSSTSTRPSSKIGPIEDPAQLRRDPRDPVRVGFRGHHRLPRPDDRARTRSPTP